MLSRRALLGATTLLPLGVISWPALAQATADGLRGSIDAGEAGVRPGALDDQSAALADAFTRAESEGKALFLPPGRYEVAGLELPRHAHLIGVPGQTRLVFRGGAFLLQSRHAASFRISGVTFDGAGLPFGSDLPALVNADDVDDLLVDDCEIIGSSASGIVLRNCAGRVERCRVSGAGTIGIGAVQSRGMSIADNAVTNCGDTGILVWRDDPGADDTIVRGNRVSAVRADSGGTGQYGNGINVSKADGVIVAQNRIDACAFSAMRFYSCKNLQAAGNTATNLGEVAIFVEFAFEGAVVSGNLIDGCVGGISFANFLEHGGRLAVCSGNIVRNSRSGPRYADGVPQIGIGIGAEADVAITGNVVDNAVFGLQLGWGPHLRDVAATGNVIRDTQVGIAVSVADGAGSAVIADNLISGAERGGILGMLWEEAATGDLAAGGAEAYPHLSLSGNRVG